MNHFCHVLHVFPVFFWANCNMRVHSTAWKWTMFGIILLHVFFQRSFFCCDILQMKLVCVFFFKWQPPSKKISCPSLAGYHLEWPCNSIAHSISRRDCFCFFLTLILNIVTGSLCNLPRFRWWLCLLSAPVWCLDLLSLDGIPLCLFLMGCDDGEDMHFQHRSGYSVTLLTSLSILKLSGR